MHLLFPEFVRAFSSCILLTIIHLLLFEVPVPFPCHKEKCNPRVLDLGTMFFVNLDLFVCLVSELPTVIYPEMTLHSGDYSRA
jgi:hypothetical protein